MLVDKGFPTIASPGFTAVIFFVRPLGSLLSTPLFEHPERKWLIVVSAALMDLFGLTTLVPLVLVTFSLQIVLF